jgi:hypothetical protein
MSRRRMTAEAARIIANMRGLPAGDASASPTCWSSWAADPPASSPRPVICTVELELAAAVVVVVSTPEPEVEVVAGVAATVVPVEEVSVTGGCALWRQDSQISG